MNAGDFRDKAAEISSALGHGRCEIFPKQEQILVERGDVGNFINLPYFDSEQTLRYAIIEERKIMSRHRCPNSSKRSTRLRRYLKIF